MSEPIKIPKTIHHSHQRQQMDLGETIYLWSSDPDTHQIVGEIYNFDDLEDLAEKDCEDVEITAIEIADKIVRAYNSHDALVEACKAALSWYHSEAGDVLGQGDDETTRVANQIQAALDKAKPKAEGETR